MGLVKNFRENPILKEFIPENSLISLSWVKLKPGELLKVHQHPVKSMIIICKGNLTFVDNKEEITLEEGDIVTVPPMAFHGFKGGGDEGFWGLSVQFENRGLYEDLQNPLVSFKKQLKVALPYFEQILEKNRLYVSEFANSKLFKLQEKGGFDSKNNRNQFMDYFQIWSNIFQKMMLARVAFCDNGVFLKYFQEHLYEEFGHDVSLKNSRNNLTTRWDPIIESAAIWFLNKIITVDNIGKIMIGNLVIENCATHFYSKFSNFMKDENIAHFESHNELDCHHANIGIEKFKNLTEEQYSSLSEIQHQSWMMLITLFDRIATLIEENH